MKYWARLVTAAFLYLTPFAVSHGESLERLQELSDVPEELIWQLEREPTNPELLKWADWLVNSPDRLGRIEYVNEPLLAGEQRDFQIRFTSGIDLPVGTEVVVLPPWQSGADLQATNPGSANYLQLASGDLQIASGEQTQFSPLAVSAPVPFARWYEGGVILAHRIADGAVLRGDEIVFRISALQLPGKAGSFYLPVGFRLPGDKVFVSGPRVELSIRPNRTEQVELIAPSRLGRNQEADITLVLKDRFGNSATSNLPSFDVLVDGNFFGRVAPTAAETSITGVSFTAPGTYQVEVRTGGGSLRAVSNPIVVQSGNRQIGWQDVSPEVVLGTEDEFARSSFALSRNSLKAGGASLVLEGANGLSVAVPYLPTDDRGLDSNKFSSVQIVAGDSQYEWFANRLLRAGYRLGFVGGSFSPLRTLEPNLRTGRTALLGFDPLASLEQGSTYATTGAKIVLHATVNGGTQGQRQPRSTEREIIGWVNGTGPLDRIELIKNGQLLATRSVAGDLESRVLKVSLRSSSVPVKGQRDLPRNGREWIGFVRSGESNLTLHSAPGFSNPSRQGIAQNGPNRVDFITWTHGGFSSFLVALDELNQDQVIELSLRGGMEDNDIQPLLRKPAALPATRLMIPLFELGNGPVSRYVEVAGYQDEVRFELINPEAPDFAEFRFNDVTPYGEEDYYYVRVLQQDDEVAWSSPVFVGGFDAP